MKYFVEEKGCLFDLLTWHKTNPAPTHNCHYLSDTEYCLMFREKGAYFGGTTQTLKKYYVSPINMEDKKAYNHPCTKPVEFIKNHLINSTKPNDIVFDPFMGSGSTLVAAKELGRKYIGIEINEKYFKVAKDRLNGINAKGQMSLLETNFEQLDLFK